MTARLKTRTCGREDARKRLEAAESYLRVSDAAAAGAAADSYRWNSYITNCVHAGIAAADAVCCLALGEHSQGDDHRQAISLIGRVAPDGSELAKALSALLSLKTSAGYGTAPLTEDKAKRAARNAAKLVAAARDRIGA